MQHNCRTSTFLWLIEVNIINMLITHKTKARIRSWSWILSAKLDQPTNLFTFNCTASRTLSLQTQTASGSPHRSASTQHQPTGKLRGMHPARAREIPRTHAPPRPFPGRAMDLPLPCSPPLTLLSACLHTHTHSTGPDYQEFPKTINLAAATPDVLLLFLLHRPPLLLTCSPSLFLLAVHTHTHTLCLLL